MKKLLDKRLQRLEKQNVGDLALEYLKTILEAIKIEWQQLPSVLNPISPEDLAKLMEIERRADEIVKRFSDADHIRLQEIYDSIMQLEARHQKQV